jgi:hypothetical protein
MCTYLEKLNASCSGLDCDAKCTLKVSRLLNLLTFRETGYLLGARAFQPVVKSLLCERTQPFSPEKIHC